MRFLLNIVSCLVLVAKSASVQPRPTNPTPCETAIGVTGRDGPYPQQIARQFPRDRDRAPVVVAGPRGNIRCICESPTWAVCEIAVLPGPQEILVRERLHPATNIRPFFLYTVQDLDFICYSDTTCPPVVLAELNIRIRNFPSREPQAPLMSALRHLRIQSGSSARASQPQVTSAGSSIRPWVFPNPPAAGPSIVSRVINSFRRPTPPPEPQPSLVLRGPLSPLYSQSTNQGSQAFPQLKSIYLRQCTHGSEETSCPITLDCFQVGDTVYILRRDTEKADQGQNVVCLSSEGVTSLANTQDSIRNGGFREPLNRIPNRRLTIFRDYMAYRIVDEACARSTAGSAAPSSVKFKEHQVRSANFPTEHFVALFCIVMIFLYLIATYSFGKRTNGYMELDDL